MFREFILICFFFFKKKVLFAIAQKRGKQTNKNLQQNKSKNDQK
jgi:hypothetical protein